MAKMNDDEFIQWVYEKVSEDPGTTAREINKSSEMKETWPELKKSDVNSALYQLESKGEVIRKEPTEGKLAPRWFPTDEGHDDKDHHNEESYDDQDDLF